MLIEVMLALALLASGLLGLSQWQVQLVQEAARLSQREEATRLAQQKIEQMRLFESSAQQLQGMASGSGDITGLGSVATRYSRSWQVSATGSGPLALSLAQCRVIAVTVSWTDALGQIQTVRIVGCVGGIDPRLAAGLWFPIVDGTVLRRPGAS